MGFLLWKTKGMSTDCSPGVQRSIRPWHLGR